MLFTGWSKNTLQRYPLPSTPPAATEANSAATIDRILTYQTIDGFFFWRFPFHRRESLRICPQRWYHHLVLQFQKVSGCIQAYKWYEYYFATISYF